jgi:hypothetical protein
MTQFIKPIEVEGEVEVNDTHEVVMRSFGTDEAETLVSLEPGASLYCAPNGVLVVMPPGVDLVADEAEVFPDVAVKVSPDMARDVLRGEAERADPRRERVTKMLRTLQQKAGGPDAPAWLATDLSRLVREHTRSI